MHEFLLRQDTKVALKCKLIFELLYKRNSMANEYFFTKDPARYLALVAHNEMNDPLVGFVQSHVKKINMFPPIAKG